MKSQRDVFLEELLKEAKNDKTIMLLSVDMGAPALDKWKKELPGQYIAMGISEQNAINVAAGLSRGGFKIFVYFMGVWIHRCFEQIRYSCAIGDNKITILGNGVGLGYAPAGPAHEPNEDVAVMRTLFNVNIYAGSSSKQIYGIVNECLNSNQTNYVRLERRIHNSAEEIYEKYPEKFFENLYKHESKNDKSKLLIISYGQVIRRIYDLKKENPSDFENVCVVEISKLWPIEFGQLFNNIDSIESILIIEEQSKSGSLAEVIGAELMQRKIFKKLKFIHLPNRYIFDNGNQDELLDELGFSKSDILKEIRSINGSN